MDVMMGFALGVVVVAPVGPISLLLMAIGLERGSKAGVRAGLGVAAADAVLLVVVLTAAGQIAAIGDGWQRGVELVLGLALVALGLRAWMSRGGLGATVQRIQRPGWVLLGATLANPLTTLAWLGLIVALGSELGHGWSLARTGVGLGLASLAWHVSLGAASGTMGARLSPKRRVTLQRASGLAMVGLGALLAL